MIFKLIRHLAVVDVYIIFMYIFYITKGGLNVPRWH
nr:MAG TPA: hypothetical protein [Caudoviricetes sp.]